MKKQTTAKHLFNNKFAGAVTRNFYYLMPVLGMLFFVLLGTVLFTGCKKDDQQADVIDSYHLDQQTANELKQAKTATARYRNIQNAIADGYTNINVDVDSMGHHYMRSNIVDSVFNVSMPEILVYHEDHDGNMELGAVEYAVPLSQPKPQGFTGTADVWDGNTTFQLWLLHA